MGRTERWRFRVTGTTPISTPYRRTGYRLLPRRVSNVIGAIAGVALFWSVISGVLFRAVLRVADASFQEYDELIEPETNPPTDPLKTGSSVSLLAWDELGRWGREFISSGPTREDISAFSGRQALEPVRVYVGLRSADTPEARAKLALEELKRVGGFERSVLIAVTPTGTGWVDPAAIDSVEYLHDGAVASVALQYSYLASWLALLVEPGYGADAARAREPRPCLGGVSGTLNGVSFRIIFVTRAPPYQLLGALEVLHGRAEFLAPQERRCNPAVYTSHDAGQIVDQTAPFARLTAQVRYPEQYSRRTYVWNPKVTTAAPAYMPTRNTAQRGMDRIC